MPRPAGTPVHHTAGSRVVAVALLAVPFLVAAALDVAWSRHEQVRIAQGDLDALVSRWVADARRRKALSRRR